MLDNPNRGSSQDFDRQLTPGSQWLILHSFHIQKSKLCERTSEISVAHDFQGVDAILYSVIANGKKESKHVAVSEEGARKRKVAL